MSAAAEGLGVAENSAVALLARMHLDCVSTVKDETKSVEVRLFAFTVAKNIETWAAGSLALGESVGSVKLSATG